MQRPMSGIRRSIMSVRKDSDDEGTDDIEKSAKQVEVALLAFRVAILLAMLGLSFYFVSQDVIKYYEYGTITGVNVELLPNVTFPAVTICNYNRWKKSLASLASPEDLNSLVQQMQAEQIANLPPIQTTTAQGGVTNAATTPISSQSSASTESPQTVAVSATIGDLNTDSLLTLLASASSEGITDGLGSTISGGGGGAGGGGGVRIAGGAGGGGGVRIAGGAGGGGGAGVSSTPSYSSSGTTVNSSSTARAPFNLYNFTRSSGWRLVDFNETASSSNGTTLLSCTYRGVECDTRFFTKITTEFGSCYTFNKNINWTSVSAKAKSRLPYPLIQTVPHEDTGLSLTINVEEWDYFEQENINGKVQVGLKVIVHSPDRVPGPNSEGIPISPGHHATIPVTWTQYSYMKPPHGTCNPDAKLEYFDKYSQEGCMWECIKKKILEVCQCVMYYQATDTDIACDLPTSKYCAYPLIGAIQNEPDVNCTCPVACLEESYEATAYYSDSPSNSIAPDLAKKYNMTESFYRENIVSFDIYMSEMAKTTVTQSEAMPKEQVMANAGGWLGLFAGVSFVTFVELIEFAFERYFAGKEKEKEKKSASSSKVHPIEIKPQ